MRWKDIQLVKIENQNKTAQNFGKKLPICRYKQPLAAYRLLLQSIHGFWTNNQCQENEGDESGYGEPTLMSALTPMTLKLSISLLT